MTQTQIIDSMIYRLKELPECENVRFVREYPKMDSENPIIGFLAVVEVKKVVLGSGYLGGIAPSGEKGELYSAEGEIMVYAPKNQNGNGLSQLVFKMLKTLGSADEDKFVVAAKAGSIEFDTNLSAVFRRISFKLEFCEHEEES